MAQQTTPSATTLKPPVIHEKPVLGTAAPQAARPVTIGLIGCGDIAVTHLNALAPIWGRFRIVAVSDLHPGRRQHLVDHYHLDARQCEDYRQLLAMPDIEAVYVLVPNHLHAQVTMDALAAGKHVFCEKPLAITVEDCTRMIQAARDANRILQVGLVFRYSRLFRKMASLIEHGAIGEPQMMWLHEFRPPFPIGRDRQWRYSQQFSGGALIEKNCHHFDLFNWMLGGRPQRVIAMGGNEMVGPSKAVPPGVPGENYCDMVDGDIIDNAWAIVEFDNHRRASLGLSLFTEGYRLPIGVVGSEGWIEVDERSKKLLLHPHRGSEKKMHLPDELGGGITTNHIGGTREQLEFADCIIHGLPPHADGEIGLWSILPALAAEQSLRESRVIEVASLLPSAP